MHPVCRAYGLLIRSAWPLPGAMAIIADEQDYAAAPDIEIIEGSAALVGVAEESGPYRYTPNKLVFERRGVARYLCEEGKRIVIEPFAGAREFDIVGSLIATALPATLWMRGEIVLHAAAAVLPSSACAIAIDGPSGSGKSTILDRLVAAGARVVGDDTLCVRSVGNVIQVSGLSAAYFLRDAASDTAEERVLRTVSEARQLPSADLAAFAVLAMPRQDNGFGFCKLQGYDALEVLLNGRHRPRIPRLLQSDACLLPSFAELAQKISVYSWQRCDGGVAIHPDEVKFLSAVDPVIASANDADGRSDTCLT